MPFYRWIAKNQNGNLLTGQTLALNAERLCVSPELDGLSLVSYEKLEFNGTFERISTDAKAKFFYNLNSLVNSGLLLIQAINLILPNIKNKNLRLIVLDIEFMLQNGLSLSHALSIYKNVFDDFTCQIIKASEESGAFSSGLAYLCQYWQLKGDFSKKIQAAIIGPAVIFCFFIIVFIVMLLYVIPSFKKLIDFNAVNLNGISTFVFGLSDFAVGQTMAFLLALVITCLLTIVLFKSFYFKRLMNRLPFINSVRRSLILTSFLKSCSMLLHSGLTLSRALVILQDKLDSVLGLNAINRDLDMGISLSDSMAKNSFYPGELVSMISAAQESGAMPQAMDFAANIYFDQLNRRLSTLTYLVQPILIVFLGLLIGVMVISIYLPLIEVPISRSL